MKRKHFILVLALLAFVLFGNFAGGSLMGDGNLACDDLLSCKGAAACNTSGDPSGCTLHCIDGASVICGEQ